MNSHPLKISCPFCAGTMGYDILRQSYACPYCKRAEDSQTAQRQWMQWRHINEKERGPLSVVSTSCPSCGASVLFPAEEVSKSCHFCGGNLVLDTLVEKDRLPDIIIPFVLTKEDAVKRLESWIHRHSAKKETDVLKKNLNRLEGYYLPYRLVKGPISGVISRGATARSYYCEGYLEGNAIHSSGFLENSLLETIEPFDWDEAKPFSLAYVGGHRVKLSTLSEISLQHATQQEVSENFRPVAEKVMQTGDLQINLSCNQLLQIPALLPVYVLRTKKVTAVVNGQTGRVSVDTGKVKEPKFRRLLEPTLLTILCTFLTCYFVEFSLKLMLYSGILFALIIFTAFEQMRGHFRNRRKVYFQGKSSRAKRVNGALFVEEGNQLLRNPFSNQPVFYETINKERIPVRIRFYSIPRLLWMISELLLILFLPAVLALFVQMLLRVAGADMSLFDIHFEYGAAWYVLAFFLCLIGYIKGIREYVYNRPILYRIEGDGSAKIIGSPASRRISFFMLLFHQLKALPLSLVIGAVFTLSLLCILSVWAMFL